MPTTCVSQIEDRLGVILPNDYRRFLSDYPENAPEDLRRFDLYDEPATIIDETLIFRRYLTDDAAHAHLIVVGDSGCGDRICLDLDSSHVLFWSHTEEDFTPVAASVADYYRLAVAEMT